MFVKNIITVVIASGVVLACFGCSRTPRPADLPKLFPAVITVLQEGKPLENALVSLHSSDPTFKWNIAAISDGEGKAALKTHGRFPGAPIGMYKVVVAKTESSNKDVEAANPNQPALSTGMTSVTLYYLIERKYTSVETTPLSVEIVKGKNETTLDIGKAVHEKGEKVEL